jgi:hypothetical protein
LSFEAPLIKPHWDEVRKGDILRAARPYDSYKGFLIIKLESNPPKWYAERGKIKTVLRNTLDEVIQDITVLAVN